MNKYTTKSGQNLYDIALAIYGSIEGIFDLLISNPDISLETIFTKGTELSYHEDFVLNKDVVSWLSNNNITVKNGNYKIANIDIKEEIKNWLNKTNSQHFSISAEISDDFTIVDKPNLINEEAETSRASGALTRPVGIISSPSIATSPTIKWDDQQLIANTINNDLIIGVKRKYAIDISGISKDRQKILFNKWYLQGMILLPSDEEELEAYYNNVATPKIKIAQHGKRSTISMQIPANRFIAIDWGDNANVEFFHYSQATARATHTYEDDESHTIIIYGHNEFTNLDFTEINGIYYALTNIYISKQFITPYANTETLNQLFITQSNE